VPTRERVRDILIATTDQLLKALSIACPEAQLRDHTPLEMPSGAHDRYALHRVVRAVP
jgi:hypothetical protein